MRMLLLVAAALILLPAGGAGAALPGFQTPSGNIHCAGYGGEVRCDIMATSNGHPKRPASCQLDWGTAYAAKRSWSRGRRLCVGDTVNDPAHRRLAYGHSWSYAGVTCTSRVSGLTCSTARGHGFFLSRARQRLF